MFKNVIKIFLNRVKASAVEFIMDILLGTLNDFRRARNDGAFDLHRRDPHAFDKEDSQFNTGFSQVPNPKNSQINE